MTFDNKKQPKPLYLLDFPDFLMFMGTCDGGRSYDGWLSKKSLGSQESQANLMVWDVFCYQKQGQSSKYNDLGCFFFNQKSGISSNIMVRAGFVIKS